jgi:hypothetical protein
MSSVSAACHHQVRNKLAQLVNVRRHKMEEGLRQISGTATVRVNGLGAYELNLIRSNFQGALDMFLKLEAVRCACPASTADDCCTTLWLIAYSSQTRDCCRIVCSICCA